MGALSFMLRPFDNLRAQHERQALVGESPFALSAAFPAAVEGFRDVQLLC